jgi:hypothetical protein
MSKKLDTLPFNMMRRLAKAEIKACENATRQELVQLAAQDRQRNKAAREGRN